MAEINFDEWKRLKMKVGQILEVERVPKTDKLYKLQVDIGEEQPIQIVSGLVPFYSERELLNRKIVVLTNLAPVKLAGEMSNGMLLCAQDGDDCVLLDMEKDMPQGAEIV